MMYSPYNPPTARAGAHVSREVVEALHDLAAVLSEAINEFSDPIHKAALRDGLQAIMDVAIVHDGLGGYGIYAPIGSEDDDILGAST